MNNLYDYVINNQNVKYILLYADGGYGKTTHLFKLTKELLKVAQIQEVIPIFIDAKKLNFKKENPIFEYIKEKLCGEGAKTENVIALFNDNNSPNFQNEYIFYLILDGLNEISDKNNVIADINKIKEYSTNTRIIVSSRVDERSYTFDDFTRLRLNGISLNNLSKAIKKHFDLDDEIKLDDINPTLIEILQIPLFLSTFFKAYTKDSIFPDLYASNKVQKANILSAYINKIEDDNKQKQNPADIDLIKFAIKFFLPKLAFEMAKNKSLTISLAEFKMLRKDFDYFDEICNDISFFTEFKEKALQICKDICKFINSDKELSFIHHIWRDYFAAQHIVNLTSTSNFDELEVSIDENIQRFVGELLGEYEYEDKDNLEDWTSSPIEKILQKHNLKSEFPLSARATSNLIDIMKVSRDNHITANYNNLDLHDTVFYGCDISNSTFNNSNIKYETFINQGHSERISSLSISPNGKYLISVDVNYIAIIWDIGTNMPIYHFDNISVKNVFFISNDSIIYSHSTFIYELSLSKNIHRKLFYHDSSIESFCISQNNEYLVSIDILGKLYFWDLNCKKFIKAERYNYSDISIVGFVSNDRIAVLVYDSIVVFSCADGSFDNWIKNISHKTQWNCVTTTNDSVVISYPYKLKIWNVISNETFEINTNKPYSKIIYNSVQNTIIAINPIGEISTYNLNQPNNIKDFRLEISDYRKAESVISNDGKTLFLSDGNNSIHVLSTNSYNIISTIIGDHEKIDSIESDEKHSLLYCRFSKKYYVIDPSRNRIIDCFSSKDLRLSLKNNIKLVENNNTSIEYDFEILKSMYLGAEISFNRFAKRFNYNYSNDFVHNGFSITNDMKVLIVDENMNVCMYDYYTGDKIKTISVGLDNDFLIIHSANKDVVILSYKGGQLFFILNVSSGELTRIENTAVAKVHCYIKKTNQVLCQTPHFQDVYVVDINDEKRKRIEKDFKKANEFAVDNFNDLLYRGENKSLYIYKLDENKFVKIGTIKMIDSVILNCDLSNTKCDNATDEFWEILRQNGAIIPN